MFVDKTVNTGWQIELDLLKGMAIVTNYTN